MHALGIRCMCSAFVGWTLRMHSHFLLWTLVIRSAFVRWTLHMHSHLLLWTLVIRSAFVGWMLRMHSHLLLWTLVIRSAFVGWMLRMRSHLLLMQPSMANLNSPSSRIVKDSTPFRRRILRCINFGYKFRKG